MNMRQTQNFDRPFTPDTLAKRWEVSASSIRDMCKRQEIEHFRLGRLYRIPAKAVLEKEQWTSASDASEADIVSIGGKTERENGIALKHSAWVKPNPKQ